MKTKIKIKLTIILISSIVVITSVMALIAGSSSARADSLGCNSAKTVNHQATLKDSRASPEITVGAICDKITFTNMDKVTREISFGGHEEHEAYDGVTEKILNINQSFSITLNKTGNFHFHDHNHEELMGYFNVTK